MSAQACFLGHYRQAARLTDAAVDRVGTCAPSCSGRRPSRTPRSPIGGRP
ncbi:hypothetical protein Q5530_13160 [Saccharothrix sp. BKS2]